MGKGLKYQKIEKSEKSMGWSVFFQITRRWKEGRPGKKKRRDVVKRKNRLSEI